MSAVVAFPLVFHLESARFFADQIFSSHYEHLPDDAACAKVGEWSWCWMEPMIGTASFSILCLQVLHTQIKDLGLKPIDEYVSRRQLRWLGHVARMDYERLPRKMLSSWVAAPRPRGAPPMTYRRSIEKALANFNVKYSEWPALAADRAAWRETLQRGSPPAWWQPPPRPPPPPPPLSLTRPSRAAAAAARHGIDAHLREHGAP